MRNLFKTSLLSAFIALSGCESEPSSNLQDSLDATSVAAVLAINANSQAVGSGTTTSLFDPANAILPTATNLLFTGTEDGTINIPIAEGDPRTALFTALNVLDGFSTSVPITTRFSAALDASYTGSSNVPVGAVRVFEVDLSSFAAAVVAIRNELTYGVDFSAALSSLDPSNQTLALIPLKPLKADSSYFVVITNLLLDANGDSVVSSSVYNIVKSRDALVNASGQSNLEALTDAQATALEPLRQLVYSSEFMVDVAQEDLAAINIVLSWSFTTQSVGQTLATVRSIVGVPITSLANSTVTVGVSGPGRSPLGAANMHEGTLTIPYYLSESTASAPNAINTNTWQAANAVAGERNLSRLNTLPVATNPALKIPLLVTTPVDTNNFPAPWKTVIFQHGITSNRTVMLAVADALARVGFAVVAIDMPLHGVAESNPFHQADNERTFNVDLIAQSGLVAVAGADGTVDTSGIHFANLANLVVTRDNIRQAVADLFALTAAIPTMVIPAIGNDDPANLDASNIYFVGHSFGAMVGTAFLSLESKVKDAVLAHGANGYAKTLDGSNSFAPLIVAGLRAASGGAVDKLAAPGLARAAYESFIGVAQTTVDSVDPINHALAATNNRGILFFEIVGDGEQNPSDLVVPNTVPDANDQLNPASGVTIPAPIAGTEAQLTLMNLTQVNSSQTGNDLKLSVKFTAGNHGSILDPSPNPVTTEMQLQMVSFLASGGNALTVTNTAVIAAP